MPLRAEPRATVSPLTGMTVLAFALLATLTCASVLFVGLGYPLGRTLYAFFLAPMLSVQGWGELALKAAPLAMMAAGLAAGFQAGVWNIGAEGQLIAGSIASGGVALAWTDTGGSWVLPVVCVAGLLGGMAWGAVPALLRTRFGVNEILPSLMLTYVASLLLSALVIGPWRDPDGYGLPQSRPFSDAATLSPVLPHLRVTVGTVIELIVPVAVWGVLRHSLVGLAIRTVGASPVTARFAGFSQARVVWIVMMAGSGLAGLAGAFEVAGPIGQLIPQITPGYGFTAIIVAFLGRLRPISIIPAAFLVALSYIGADTAQLDTGLPKGVAGMIQGLLLIFPLAADFFVRHRVRWMP